MGLILEAIPQSYLSSLAASEILRRSRSNQSCEADFVHVNSSNILISTPRQHPRAVASAKELCWDYLGNKVFRVALSSSPQSIAVPNLARVGLLGQTLNQVMTHSYCISTFSRFSSHRFVQSYGDCFIR